MSLRNTSRPTPKATGCEILLYMVFYSATNQYISQAKQVGHELIQLLGHKYSFFSSLKAQTITRSCANTHTAPNIAGFLELTLTQLQILQVLASRTQLLEIKHWHSENQLAENPQSHRLFQYLTYSFHLLQIILSRVICNSLFNYQSFRHSQAKSGELNIQFNCYPRQYRNGR